MVGDTAKFWNLGFEPANSKRIDVDYMALHSFLRSMLNLFLPNAIPTNILDFDTSIQSFQGKFVKFNIKFFVISSFSLNILLFFLFICIYSEEEFNMRHVNMPKVSFFFTKIL